MNVTMIGTGYVGLVSGACFSEFGVNVTCVDKDANRIKKLHEGIMPIYEPGLEDLVATNVKRGRLSFTTDTKTAVENADIVFIAVGTPTRRGDGHADLSYVQKAAREIAENLSGYTVIIDKSTVPVGTARNVERIIHEVNPTADFDVASNPEFLREGSAINDFMRPDRVVIGAESEKAKNMLRELYRPLYLIETPMVVTNLETAELIKYACNAFLATKISFINEISQLCEVVGADVQSVAKGMGLDRRIGPKFLHAGPGYGGSCLPKDTKAMIKIFQDNHLTARIVEAVVQVNDAQKSHMVKKVRDALGGNLYGKTISVLGLTFKPETDDMREAPSLTIIPALQESGVRIRATDPQGVEESKKKLSDIQYFEDPYTASEGVDAVIIMTEWNEYRALSLENLKKSMKGDILIDLRNIYDAAAMRSKGFTYVGVGIQ